jgi:type I restriction enzyme M protein
MISKMDPKGSRIGIVLNGSPMFTGDGGSGESEIRKWIIENDMLECIVSLPDRLFFNTGIMTYLWIVTNKKSKERQGKVQLIDGSNFYTSMRKNLGEKSKKVSVEGRKQIVETYNKFIESEVSQIHNNEYFGYTKVTIEQPLEKDGVVITTKQGKVKPDTSKRDHERIPLSNDIEDYFEREVKPHLPDSWMDESKNKVGYEINFTKYFYQYKPLRSMSEITQDLLKLEQESENLLKEIIK